MYYEIRTYRLKVGTLPSYLALVGEEGLAIQRSHLGHLVGYFHSDIGPQNQIVHIWAFDSLDERERRRQATHPAKVKPELVAHSPNTVWSWDITKLRGPTRGVYLHLYVVIDVFSRYVVGWLVADYESSTLANKLFLETCSREGIVPGQLTIHADRGSSMKSKPVALLLADLGVTKTHSRPHTSDDNPFSEAQFKTLKYRPDFPDRFGCLQDCRAHCRDFFSWYNCEHRHSGIRYVTPTQRHAGEDKAILAARHQTYLQARESNPARWSGNTRNWSPIGIVTLNPERDAVIRDLQTENKTRLAA